jgi:hypothetical protein
MPFANPEINHRQRQEKKFPVQHRAQHVFKYIEYSRNTVTMLAFGQVFGLLRS